jgi:hypothetical protein
MKRELRMQGYMIRGELHVREADCRRAVSEALTTGKEELIKSHDDLLAALRPFAAAAPAMDTYVAMMGAPRDLPIHDGCSATLEDYRRAAEAVAKAESR